MIIRTFRSQESLVGVHVDLDVRLQAETYFQDQMKSSENMNTQQRQHRKRAEQITNCDVKIHVGEIEKNGKKLVTTYDSG